MKKIKALHHYIAHLNWVTDKQLNSYVDLLHSKIAGRPDSNDANRLVIAECNYTARFYISGFPFVRYPIELLSANLSAWLLDNDINRKEPAEITINVDVNDKNGAKGNTAELEFEVLFDELLIIEPNVQGDVIFNDTRYSMV